MSAMALPRLEQSADHRVLAGVCGGIAEALDVDPTLVRLVFTLLALAGGAGIALYAALWFYMRGQHWIALLPAAPRRVARAARARPLGHDDARRRADRRRARR